MPSDAVIERPGVDRGVFAVKWGASIIQIMGYTATGFGWTPWNLYLFLIGVLGWFAVGVLWNDRALMLVHLVALGAMIAGMASGSPS
ncbi:MAG: ubiquinone biosynthesis methyltransferase UbiE [Rhodobacter sp.]|nr:ubiquinone biosynthesis methyltransferase UbiE [Rhodobacter sp.]